MMECSIDVSSALCALKGIVNQLQDETIVSYDGPAQQLLDIVESLPTVFITKPVALLEQIEQYAVDVWNFAVTKKAGRTLPPLVNAKLRHAALNLVRICNFDGCDESTYKKQILMSLKSARAWLDADNPVMADSTLDLTDECLDRLRHLIHQSGSVLDAVDTVDDEKVLSTEVERMLELDRNQFRCLSYRAECAFAQDNGSKSLDLVKKAQTLSSKLSNENGLLAMLCYNFGVSCFEKHCFTEAVEWLKESYDVGKIKNCVSPRNQARTLRLLATCYLECNESSDHHDKAMNAINLANAEHCSAAGLFLKLRVLLRSNAAESSVMQAADSVLKHGELTVDEAISATQLIFEHSRHDLALSVLKQICGRFQHSPDLWKVSVAHLDLLLRAKRQQTAQALIEDLIVEQETGCVMDQSGLRKVHLLLWDQAAQCIEAKQFSESLSWYKLSHRLATQSSIGDNSLAKLYRNMASTHLELNQLQDAENQLCLAERLEPASVHMLYLKYKLAVLRDDQETAVETLKKIDCSADTDVHGLICLAAQLAFEHSKSAVAVHALESLVTHSADSRQILTALRCLVRLRVTNLSQGDKSANVHTIAKYIHQANEELSKLSAGEKTSADIEPEATWFLKIAWNVALQCEGFYDVMHQLFVYCYNLTSLCAVNTHSLGRQKTCQLMAAVTGLQLARSTTDDQIKVRRLQESLTHIQQCRTVCEQLQSLSAFSTDADTTTPLLLVLYEFEAKSKLGLPDTEKVLDRVMTLPQAEPKIFEALAALALQSKKDSHKMCIKALKVAINKHLQSNKTDFNKCSKAFHSLLELTMQDCGTGDIGRLKEAWTYFTEVVDIIETRAKTEYPEMEVLWLMTKGWNCGLHLFSGGLKAEAMRWCEAAMRLLNYIGSLKLNYETQMSNAYSELLAKMDASS